MTAETLVWLLALVLTAGIPAGYILKERKRSRQAREALELSRELGRDEPPSLHPAITDRCAGMGACERVCPEGKVIGLINNRATLIDAARCIGHGECAAACPVDAIRLVFGTARRGVDLPEVAGDFQSTVRGIYVAGELGGMGLIRNAFTQGRQAVQAIAGDLRANPAKADPDRFDLLVVGAGPAGLSAALQANVEGLRVGIVDQYGLGGAILSYPRRKLVMTRPVEVPGQGRWNQHRITKEELLEKFQAAASQAEVVVQCPWQVARVEGAVDDFTVVGPEGATIRARRVLLAIGRRGTPRRLGVPGEDQQKVAYQLLEPEIWAGDKVLVVGGGDSALEAAVALAGVGCQVSLSYRQDKLARAREANVEAYEAAVALGHIRAFLSSTPVEIGQDHVVLKQKDVPVRLENDQVFIFAGGELPTAFLQGCGIGMRRHTGRAND